VETKLVFKYDREGDILSITKRPPYPEQESEELGDEVIARLNPKPARSKIWNSCFFNSTSAQRSIRTTHLGRPSARGKRELNSNRMIFDYGLGHVGGDYQLIIADHGSIEMRISGRLQARPALS
jgi:hypothetical protein